MYHAAKACLLLKGSSPRTHGGVVSGFGKYFVMTGEVDASLGRALSVAKEDREDSDYEVHAEISEKEAGRVLKEAEAFLGEAEEIVRKLTKGSKT